MSDEMLEQETHNDVAAFAAVLSYRIVYGRRDEHFQHAHGHCDGGWAVDYADQVSETTTNSDQAKRKDVSKPGLPATRSRAAALFAVELLVSLRFKKTKIWVYHVTSE